VIIFYKQLKIVFIKEGDMPGFDGTGPQGFGPMTGRRFGFCVDGTRRTLGRGFGFGCRRQVFLTKDQEKKILESELKNIESEKEEIQKRLKEIN
jgi:hypothetical protein